MIKPLAAIAAVILLSLTAAQAAGPTHRAAKTELSKPVRVIQAACSGCGCRGGPGWRVKKTGKCASRKNIDKQCGSPPSPKRCTNEKKRK